MSKICTFCGAMNSDSAVICSRCKKQLKSMAKSNQRNAHKIRNTMNTYVPTNSAITRGNGNRDYASNSASYTQNPNNTHFVNYRDANQSESYQNNIILQQSNHTNKLQKKSFVSKKKKILVISVITVISVCMLIGVFSILNKPSESWLKDNLPREMLKYRLVDPEDSGIDSGEIQSLEIVEQYEEMGYPAYNCKVVEESEDLALTRYFKFICEHKGLKWVVNSVEEYQNPDCVAKDELNCLIGQKHIQYIDGVNIESCGNPSVEKNKSGLPCVYCDITATHTNADLSGKIGYKFSMISEEGEDGVMVIRRDYDTDEFILDRCKIKWKLDNIVGKWQWSAGTMGRSEDGYLELIKSGKNSLDWTYRYENYYVYTLEDEYSKSGTTKLPTLLSELDDGFSVNEKKDDRSIFYLSLDELCDEKPDEMVGSNKYERIEE